METIVLGGGCFWCLDASYRLVQGVTNVVSGYAGGNAKDADYYTIASQQTGHVEVVQVTFDTSQIKLEDILDIFWAIHDPTTMNRQGHDVGPEYRSVIFYADDRQQQIAEASKQQAQTLWDTPIVTAITPLEAFYPAEEYHQNYFQNNPEQAYCQMIINPKLAKLRQKFAARLKQQ